ncbi:MAG: sialidase family protein [Lysobacteraceae bacterium]|jgi:predicted neuraminidase
MKRINLVSKEFVCDNPEPFYKACHVSTIARNEDGDLAVAYFAGTKEGSLDLGIWLSRKINEKWEEPKRIKYMYGFQHWNPILRYDGNGRLVLLYKVGHSVQEWYTMISESDDFGLTWNHSREAIEGDHTPRLSTKNRILIQGNDWFAGTSVETNTHHDCLIDISRDGGKTWTLHPIPFDHITQEKVGKFEWEGIKELWISDPDIVLRWDGVIQPTLWSSAPGKISCLMRSSRGYLFRSDSEDNGETWSKAYKTQIPNNNCGIDIAQLSDNTLVLFYNPVSVNWGERTPLSVSLSTDNGISWTKPFDIETESGEYSYPFAIVEDNRINLTYTWRRKKIVHCVLTIE